MTMSVNSDHFNETGTILDQDPEGDLCMSAKSRKGLLLFIMGILLSLCMTSLAMADVLNAQIRGVATDATGGVVPGVTITATNVDTGISRKIVTGEDGSYDFLALPIGHYKVTAELPGFKTFVTTGITLQVNQVYVLNPKMEVGEISTIITVQSNPAQVDTTNMQLGSVVSGNTIVDLPLNGRNWVQLQQLQSGVVASSDRFTNNYATNGSQTQQNSYLINGTDSNDLPLNTPLVIPSPDAIAEFRLVTNTLNPEYGRNSGAVLNAVIKSGTNNFHGSGFEFFRDTSLNARNFFQKTPSVFHQNQFGGTVGGPIWKNHTFFFFSYQGIRARQPSTDGTGQTSVFTPAERNGDFSSSLASLSSNTSPFPLVGENGQTYPAGTPYTTIFPNFKIPTSDFNQISASLVKTYVPLPNAGLRDFDFNPVRTTTNDQEILRIDHTFSEKDSLFGYAFYQRNPTTDDLPFTGATIPGFAQVSKSHIQQYTSSWTHVFSGRMLNEARAGYTRLNFAAVFPLNPTLPSSVGFNIDPQLTSGAGLPLQTITGYFTLGFSNNGPQPRIDQTYQATDNFSWTVGSHMFKFGFDMRRFEVYNPFSAVNNGAYNFGANGPYSTGDPGADYLLGIPDSYAQGSGGLTDARAQEYYSYAQDQWKARRNLTITYGLGWQIDTPITQKAFNGHGLNAFRPGEQSTIIPTSPVGWVYPGDPGVDNATGVTKWGHFGPRFGFAWSPDLGWLSGGPGRMSIRGGYGIYFNRSEEEVNLQFVGGPPFGISSGGIADAGQGGIPSFASPFCDIRTGACITNKFPYGGPSPNIDFSQFLPMSASTVDPNFTNPYSENFNLTVERQLSHEFILSVGYVGLVSHHNLTVWELNPGINPAGCAADPTCVANRGNQWALFPQNFKYDPTIFGSVGNVASTGNSNYNSLQVSLNKHFSKGLQFLAAYTYAHALDNASGFENAGFGGSSGAGMDPFNRAGNYGNSAFDARQRLVISYVYDIPSIRRFNVFQKIPSRITDGWRITGITTFQSGFPIYAYDSAQRSLTDTNLSFFQPPDKPDSVGSAQFVDPRTGTFVNAVKGGTTSLDHYYFNPNSFALEPFGTIGNAGRGAMHGPGINNWDFSLMKDTKLTEATRLQLRLEFYNIFNHTQFLNPVNNINSSNFGRVTSARDPRLIQLAAKFYF
jgi:hypothetical protein